MLKVYVSQRNSIFTKLTPSQISPQIVPVLEHLCLSHSARLPANSQWYASGRRSGRRGVVWRGPAGVLLLHCIISDEPSCAVLFSPWVKWCQRSWLMRPPAVVRVGSRLEYSHRSVTVWMYVFVNMHFYPDLLSSLPFFAWWAWMSCQ